MPKDLAFLAHLDELLDPLGKISSKIMFGGHGIYCNGIIMGLVIERAFYLKVDEQTKSAFINAGCKPFVYDTKTKTVEMSYWSAPDEAMESSEQMFPWAKFAYESALRKDAGPKSGARKMKSNYP